MVVQPGRMVVEPGRWCPLTLETIGRLPAAAGVFELATLVRNVVYIGRAAGSLRERLTQMARADGPLLPRVTGGYYFRYTSAPDEDAAFEALIAEHQRRRGTAGTPSHRAAA
jgi:hypothetical protein